MAEVEISVTYVVRQLLTTRIKYYIVPKFTAHSIDYCVFSSGQSILCRKHYTCCYAMSCHYPGCVVVVGAVYARMYVRPVYAGLLPTC